MGGRLLRVPAWAVLTALVALSTSSGRSRRGASTGRGSLPTRSSTRSSAARCGRTATLSILGGDTGFYTLLYPILVGLPLGMDDLDTGRRILQVLQALAMSATAVPVYLWGRSPDASPLGARRRDTDADAALARLFGPRDERDALPAAGDRRALGARARARAADGRTAAHARRRRRSRRRDATAGGRLRARRRHGGGRQGAPRPRPRGPAAIRAGAGSARRGDGDGRRGGPLRCAWRLLDRGRGVVRRRPCPAVRRLSRDRNRAPVGARAGAGVFAFVASRLSAAASVRRPSEHSWPSCSRTCRGSQSRWASSPPARSTTWRAATCSRRRRSCFSASRSGSTAVRPGHSRSLRWSRSPPQRRRWCCRSATSPRPHGPGRARAGPRSSGWRRAPASSPSPLRWRSRPRSSCSCLAVSHGCSPRSSLSASPRRR